MTLQLARSTSTVALHHMGTPLIGAAFECRRSGRA
jgi:hypothetical protein